MNWLELWFIRRIFAWQVKQGLSHDQRITELYALIREALDEEFVEDNAATLDAYAWERFNETQKCVPLSLIDKTKSPKLMSVFNFGKEL